MKKNNNAKKKGLQVSLLLICLLCSSFTSTSASEPIELKKETDLWGVLTDENNQPIQGVVVSDGFSSVQTDAKGVYQLKRNPQADHVFYSTPATCKVEVVHENNSLAKFYRELKEDQERYDFQLERLPAVENRFTLFSIGDPQVKDEKEANRFREDIVKDMHQSLKETKSPHYALVMGDLMHIDPLVFPSMKQAIGEIGVPTFLTIGNHDKLKGATKEEPRNATLYQQHFGPRNYSFNRGKVHFIAMDNIIYANEKSYRGGFTDEQVEWLKGDLSFVPKDNLIILFYHIPLRNHKYNNRKEVLELLEGFAEVHLMSGHTHYTENFTITSPIKAYEHVHSAACGAWWWSVVNGDGTPNGYAVYEIDGNKIRNWYYKSAKFDKSHQMRLYRGNAKFGGEHGYFTFGEEEDLLIANVWNADPNWKIEIYEDGVKQGEMKPWKAKTDAWAQGFHIGVVGRKEANYSQPAKHLFIHKLNNPKAEVLVVATDPFGNRYMENKITTDLETAGQYK